MVDTRKILYCLITVFHDFKYNVQVVAIDTKTSTKSTTKKINSICIHIAQAAIFIYSDNSRGIYITNYSYLNYIIVSVSAGD